jgi:hypothetical protein
MQPNYKASELAAVVETIDPVSQGAGSVSSGWIDASKFRQYMAVVMAGVLGASATLDAKLEQATDASGTGVKDITGKAITQLTKAGTDDNKQAVINLRPEMLDLDGAFDHFRVTLTVGVAASLVGAVVLGLTPASGFAAASDVSTVDEIVG